MSIKHSLKLSLILSTSLSLIFMTLLTYTLSYNKYLELAKNSISELAEAYAEGFSTQLNVQIAEIEGLAQAATIQNIALESYNGVTLGADSPYYESVRELLGNTSNYMGNSVQYYIYDLNGYFIASSDESYNGDWEEYMNIPVTDITTTRVLNASNINKTPNSIELISPIVVKDTVVGLVRANINSSYFGAFIPDNGNAFILTQNGDYLFDSDGLSKKPKLEARAKELFSSDKDNGYLGGSSIRNMYGYHFLNKYDWIYIVKMDDTNYTEISATLPVTLLISLAVILFIMIKISNMLVHKYTEPIISLKNNMAEAASGKLDLTCEVKSEDEFGELADMFNKMMNIISSNYNQLIESKKILEANEIELKKNYAHIEQLAYRDGLTGLYNRVAFMKHAYEMFHKDGSQLTKHAIFFLDMDNFKNVNDTLGHDYGDILLKQLAERLNSCLSDNDILARTGGDEFLIFKTSFASIDTLTSFAMTLVDIVHQPFNLEGEVANVSISIGIALFPRDGLTISELIKNADIAMYNAKNSGKNSFKFFNSYMEDDVNRRNDLVEILSHVIDKKEIYLQYQPQVNVQTGEITGYEALMRIQSGLAGFISPAEFIPIAEDSGIINELGEWALYEACTFNQRLIDSGYGPLRVSVNVSTTQLRNDRLADIIKSIPEKTGMNLKYLEIEITESVLMNSFEHNLKLINQIKELGASIALDDFGTGYSSFNYLTQIPIDTLKIDKSFIDGICNNPKDRFIADSIISLAHKMDISVVAEGVEDMEQLEILRSQFCDTLQGYLFSKPLGSNKFIELLDEKMQPKAK